MVWFWLAAVAPSNLTRLNPYSPGRESADGWWSEIIRRKVLQDELSSMVSTSGFAKRWAIALMWYKPSPDGRFVIGFTVNTTSSLLCPLPLLLGCMPHCLEISTLDCSFWLIALGNGLHRFPVSIHQVGKSGTCWCDPCSRRLAVERNNKEISLRRCHVDQNLRPRKP